MTKHYRQFLSATLFVIGAGIASTYSIAADVQAKIPVDELLHKLNASVVRVQVALSDGGYGVGSGVVVAKDQVATNCHVISGASSVSVVLAGESYAVRAIKPDWRHDVCIVKVEGLKAPIVKLGATKNLKYEQPLYSIGYPGFLASPVSTAGFVKGLYVMDDSVIVRATNTFRLGDSAGGVFDEAGHLVGLMTLKSPGRNAYYYNMPVEWVQALINKPEQTIHSKGELPFWALSETEWPLFMRVVQPYKTEDWKSLLAIATAWTQQEPSSSEAWFYLATAEFAMKNTASAETHFHKVVAMNDKHSQAFFYLGLIAQANGKHIEALDNVALLTALDNAIASELKLAMGMVASN